MLDLSRARERMVEIQIARRGVRDPRVLDAMRRVPREAFVESGFEEFAYEDGPLPIGEGQTAATGDALIPAADRACKRNPTTRNPAPKRASTDCFGKRSQEVCVARPPGFGLEGQFSGSRPNERTTQDDGANDIEQNAIDREPLSLIQV
jgi:Protein-L-isoaspartate(D-aspartate) O-methyltransferase (PCMT)